MCCSVGFCTTNWTQFASSNIMIFSVISSVNGFFLVVWKFWRCCESYRTWATSSGIRVGFVLGFAPLFASCKRVASVEDTCWVMEPRLRYVDVGETSTTFKDATNEKMAMTRRCRKSRAKRVKSKNKRVGV